MKLLQSLILGCLIVMPAMFGRAQISDAGWYNVTNLPPAPQSRSSFVNISQQFHPNGLIYQPNVPSVPVAEAITPQIQALADGLQDNPQRIFDYVHDHVRFLLYYGSKKGAELTLLEKSGNDFDQCALLVALLSAAGYSNNVTYQFGWMEIPYDDPSGQNRDFHHWWQLTLNNTNWTTTLTYFNGLTHIRGYPLFYYFDDNNTLEIQRMWVSLSLGTNTYQLDPAFKVSEPIAGISLTNAIGDGAISNTLATVASGNDTGNYVTNLNEAAIRGKLTGYTTNLLNYLQSNAPNASIQQILSGWQIVPATTNDFSTSYAFTVDTFSGQMPVLGWTYEPTNMMSTLRITFANTNYQWYMPQLEGERLSLVFSNNGVAQLWQDDTLLAQGVTSGSGSTNVTLATTHPVGNWDTTNNAFIPNPTNFANATTTAAYQSTNSMYALLYAFEPDWSWLQQRENKLDAYLQQGLTNGSRQVTSETLNIMGLSWMLQTAQSDQMLAVQSGMLPQYYHRIGRMAQEIGNGYYLDVYMELYAQYPSGGNDAAHFKTDNAYFDTATYFDSAFEYGLIEQFQNTNIVGASTTKMLEIANTNGQAVYLASSTNWTTGFNVASKLAHYTPTTLATITNYINAGYYVLLPQNGSNYVAGGTGTWAGYGYEAWLYSGGQTRSMPMIVAGQYGGISSVYTVTIAPGLVVVDLNDVWNRFISTPLNTWDDSFTFADPVDAADGTFQVEETDLSLGQMAPHGIAFSRYYNGTRRFNNSAGMAGGWIHNYSVSANNGASPVASLGGTTPEQSASMLTATAAALAMYSPGNPDPKNWLTTALVAKWAIDQITKKSVSVMIGQETLQFVQQPNGVFTPPANCTATLTQTNSAYSLLMRHGNRLNFNATGLLTNMLDQYGQSLNLTYNSNNLVSTVKDWKNRTLTFNYTSGQLTSVSDGARTVSYGYSTAYSPQGDLTSFTDAEGKTSTYVYDTNHQITAVLDALNRLVVTNFYDNQGHITTQYTDGLTNRTWHVYWSGWQTIEQDPMGGQRISSYDDQGRAISLQDQLGQVTQTFYDGQNHAVQSVSPLNETNQFVYDGNNNLIQKIDAFGFTNKFTYDNQNNLIATVDARGNTNSYGYNANFSLVGVTNGAGDWINYSYNANGTLASKTDPGGTTTYGYDAWGQLSSLAYPNGLGTEYFTNSVYGDVTNHADARGFTTVFSYNNRRQMTNTVASTNLVTQTAYDAIGNVASATDSRGNVASNTWSITRKLLGTTLPITSQGVPVFTNIYDTRDSLVESIDANSQPTLYTNDTAGRLISQTDPLLRTTLIGYDANGRKLFVINAANGTNSQTWDARGSLIRSMDGAGHFFTRAYDSTGNQILLTNRNGNVWQFRFDAANRLTNTVSPLGRASSIAFNHQGLPILTIDPAGQMTTNTYDGRARLVSRADKIGITTNLYDANNNLTNLIENGNTNVWTYDAYNRVSSYKDVYGNLIQYRHDANGNVTNLIYPGGKVVAYAYDSLNRLTNVMDWSGRKTAFTYDLDNRIKSIARPNGSSRTISYDAAGEATNILEQMSNSLPIALFEYNWANSGNMAWEFIAPLPHTNPPPTRTMTYDADNQLATFNGASVTEDLDGNLTDAPLTNSILTTYAYDARNRLLSAGGVTNAYDAMNNRIGQVYGTNSTVYVVNPNAKLPQVLMRIKNGVTNYYIYGAGLLYQITEAASGTNTLTYHYDYRGSTIALSGDNGIVTDRIEYSAYGLTTYRSGTNDTPFLFNGRYSVQSDPNGLLYMRSRYYNPYVCRFINPDPSGFKGGLNLYAYANGNPISYLDPFGLAASTEMDENTYYSSGLDTSENSTPSSLLLTLGGGDASATYSFYNINPNADPGELLMASIMVVPVLGDLSILALSVDATIETSAIEEMVTVTHFTSAEGAAAIGEGGFLNAGSFVTTSDLSGLSSSEVESTLEIDSGKGAFSTTFQTPASNLGPAFNGPFTSGGAIQFQIINPAQVTTFITTQ